MAKTNDQLDGEIWDLKQELERKIEELNGKYESLQEQFSFFLQYDLRPTIQQEINDHLDERHRHKK